MVYDDPSGHATQYHDKVPETVDTPGAKAVNDKKTTEGFNDWLNKGEANNKVYFGVKEDVAEYTGITKQTNEARLYQHRRNGKDFDSLETQYQNLTRNQARAIEQYFIENGPNKLNKINSISPDNKFYKDAKDWAEQYLGK